MAILAYPCVEGELGLKTKNAFVVQVDVLKAAVNSITEPQWNDAGIEVGDLVFITFSDGAADLYRLPDSFGALLVFTSSIAP